jgi:hypothetical protein
MPVSLSPLGSCGVFQIYFNFIGFVRSVADYPGSHHCRMVCWIASTAVDFAKFDPLTYISPKLSSFH